MTQPTDIKHRCPICSTFHDANEESKKNKAHCLHCRKLDGEVFKAAAQLRKAIKLSTKLIEHGGKPQDTINPTVRRMTEKLADVPESSDTTWALVGVLMQGG